MEQKELISLIQKAQSGDSAAITQLVETAQNHVYYQCRKMMGNEQDGQDLAQEVLIRMLQKLSQLQEPAAFWGWLNRMTANLCKNALSRTDQPLQFAEDEEGHSVLDDMENMDDQEVPDKAIDNAETRRMVTELVDALPEAQRLCVLMFYYNEMSVRDIAQALDVPENTVKSRLNYARKSIKEGALDYERKGVKLYGLSPLPFLLYFLHQEASATSVDLATSVLADTGVTTAVGAAAGAGTTVGAAGRTAVGSAAVATKTVARPVVVKLIAGAIVGMVAVGGVTGVVTHTQTKAGMQEELQQQARAIQQETDNRIAALEAQVEELSPKTYDEAVVYLDRFLLQEQEAQNKEWITSAIAKADALAADGKHDWAMLVLNNALQHYPEEQSLLETKQRIENAAWVPLFNLDWKCSTGNFTIIRQTVTDNAGMVYDSGNTYRVSAREAGDYGVFPLDAKYKTLTGKTALLRYDNGHETIHFVIKGDGRELYRSTYGPEDLTSFDWPPKEEWATEDFFVDVSGVDVLTVQFYGANDSTANIMGSPVGNATIANLGLIDLNLYR